MGMRKLTDEEVLKSLECCSCDAVACEEACPLVGSMACTQRMCINALDLIHRLQEENERLKRDVHDMSWVIKIHKYCVGADHCQNSSAREFELQKQADELTKENKELYKENTTLIAGSILERKNIAKDTAKEILDEVSKHYGGAWLVELYKKYGLEVE